MSLEAIGAVLAHSTTVGTQRLVLTAIAFHIGLDPREGCWPSQETLADETNLSTRSIRRIVKELVAMKELECWVNDGEQYGAARRNRYYLTIECPANCDRSLAHRERHSWSKLPVDNSDESKINLK